MDPSKLSREQQITVERLMYAVPGLGSDRIYAETVAEIIAQHDEMKDQRIKCLENYAPNQVLLFRGPELCARADRRENQAWLHGTFGDEEIHVRHDERFVFLDRSIADPQAVQHNFIERFRRYGHACAHCRSLSYYSQNWQEFPEWLQRQCFDAKYGRGAWERSKAETAEIIRKVEAGIEP